MPIDTKTVALVLSLISIVTVIYGWGYKWGQMQVKINVLWDLFIRRATVEALEKAVITKNSPLMLNPDVKKLIDATLGPDLIKFYNQNGNNKLKDRDLFIKLEEQFGERISQDICRPLKLYAGACIIAAMQYCKEEVGKVAA